MGLDRRQILVWLVISLVICNAQAKKVTYCKTTPECKKIYQYSSCVQGKCGCRPSTLVLGEKACEFGPLHKCVTSDDCDRRTKCELQRPDDCYRRAKCIEGKCFCQGNTIGDGRICRDPLDCPDKTFSCGDYGRCVADFRLRRVPACICDEGYVREGEKLSGKCVECNSEKECNSRYSDCVKGICKCKDELIRMDDKVCKKAPLHRCKDASECHPKADCLLGKCRCKGNTVGNGGEYCRDSLPCPASHKCDSTSICVLDPLKPFDGDKPVCKCRDGFIKSIRSGGKKPTTICQEATDCALNGLTCPTGTICAQVLGVYDCVCEEGFKIVKNALGIKECKDIDECVEREPCYSDSECINSIGSYKCQCNNGYRNDAENKDKCEDMDECSEEKNPCKIGEKCENQPGTYTCVCDTGYVTDNGKCVKFSECICKENEQCIQGRCKCIEGYKRNEDGKCVHQHSRRLRGSSYSLHVSGHLTALVLGLLCRLAFTA